MNTPTPEECIQKLQQRMKDVDSLSLALDDIVTTYKFKIFKISGAKKYAYYRCFRSGSASNVNQENKVTGKNSKKTGITFLIFC